MKRNMNHLKKAILSYAVVLAALILVSCAVKVNNLEYTVDYNSKTYEGKYTGTSKNNIPQDEGKFVCGNEGDNNYFIYDGSWENGEMKGSGTLITNNYTVHFPKTEMGDAIDRTGKYNGSVVDGIANGEGSFTATNDKGEEYTYEGHWKDGLYDGQGKQRYKSADHFIQEGNFENGEFKPTPAELVKMMGTRETMCEYEVSDDVFDFITKHEDVFIDHNIDSIEDMIKADFSLVSFKKDDSNDEPYFIKLNDIKVHSAAQSSSPSQMYGYDFTETLCQDDNIEPYRLYYFGHSDKLTEGNYFNAVVLPLNYSTYDTVDGGKAWALVGWIVKID